VRRYADLVYSAALRQVGVSEQARDVAQTVFADLARKAGSMNANTLLIGWLYRGARLAAIEQLRKDRRRLERERLSMELLDSSTGVPDDWNAIRPVLDEAIASLANAERDALLLRFFKDESLASVGARLGISEDAAQKRVSRALNQLRVFLGRRGINTTASALPIALVANAVQAAPVGFAASLTAGALANTAAGASPLLFKLFTFTNMKTTIIVLLLTGGICALGLWQQDTKNQLRASQTLVQRQADEIAGLRSQNDQLANVASELDRLRLQAKDMPRLRGEIAQLRRENTLHKGAAIQASQAQTNSSVNPEVPPIVISAKFISVPRASLQAFGWSQGMANSGGIGSMGDSQAKAALHNLESVEGMELLSSPRVATRNGIEASLFAGQSIPLDGTNAPVGVTMRVNPHYSTNSPDITLDVDAQFSQLIDTSVQQDHSQSGLRVTTITNSLTVVDGETIVLQQEILGDGRSLGSTNLATGPKNLLVFLTSNITSDEPKKRLESVVRRN
jgi:RNA polymerase sigma factor (sigma-70 family)